MWAVGFTHGGNGLNDMKGICSDDSGGWLKPCFLVRCQDRYLQRPCVYEKSLQLCLTLATLWTVARQALLSMGFSKQEYWSGLPYPSQFSSVQSLSCVWLFATPELQHARPPCPSPTPKFTQTHDHWVGGAIQWSHPLSSPSPPAFNLSQHQGLLESVSSHQVAKILEFRFQHQSFQ